MKRTCQEGEKKTEKCDIVHKVDYYGHEQISEV